jgi:hypothetical protein
MDGAKFIFQVSTRNDLNLTDGRIGLKRLLFGIRIGKHFDIIVQHSDEQFFFHHGMDYDRTTVDGNQSVE